MARVSVANSGRQFAFCYREWRKAEDIEILARQDLIERSNAFGSNVTVIETRTYPDA